MEVVGKISTYKNPINLYNRFGDYLKENREERFKKSNNKIILNNGSTASDLMQTIRALEEEKHSVAENVKQHVWLSINKYFQIKLIVQFKKF